MADFVAWRRPAVFALATTPPVSARLQADLPITLHDDAGDVAASAPFLLAGPGDIAALSAGQIIGRRPHPGCIDAEATMMVHVELASADLPWRYSPVAHTPGLAGLRPWLVLVVGSRDEVMVLADGRVRLSGQELFDAHPLGGAHRWAHVHRVPDHEFSRVICPRALETGHDYVAVLVPGWQATVAPDGTAALADSWPAGGGTVTLPCFDSWTFRTTVDPGDFATISRRLEPLDAAETTMLVERRFGRAGVAVGPVPDALLATGGALAVIPKPGDPPVQDSLPAAVSGVVESLATNLDVDGRWVLTLPRYDTPWYPGPVDGEPWQWPPPGDDEVPDGWRRQLRADPRHRGAAGLGAWIAIAWQDRIAAGAARQAAAVAAAAQRIRHLTLGLRASGSLWRRRVPVDPVARLATLSPLLGRMPADGAARALDAVDGRTPMLTGALLSSAARRMLRRRGPLERSAEQGATSLAALITAANHCPDAPQLPDAEASVLDAIADEAQVEQLAGGLRERAFDVLSVVTGDERTARQLAQSLDDPPQTSVDLLTGLRERPPTSMCRPLPDLVAFADSVAAGIDPTSAHPVVVDRVLAGITGLRAPLLAEPDVAPEIDIPLWKFLSENSPDWLLPGSGDIPPDRVLAVETNPPFVDAVLIGANVQTLGELRWRNLPITTRWTPLRRFWERIDVGEGKAAPDIRSVVALANDQPLWTDASTLGDVTHLADAANGTNLVIVLHTELFRRYPATIVYLTPNDGSAATWGEVPDVDVPARKRDYPTFSGTLTPELVFFGFAVPPAAAADHWLVLEEPPPGYRFKRPAADASVDGAAFASATFAPPARVFFGNLL